MSNDLNETNRDDHINSTFRKRFYKFMSRLGNFCRSCSRKKEHNTLPIVSAVDSVRLVYMRRIEEVSLISVRSQQENDNADGVNESTQTRNVIQTRTRQKIPTIITLEKALKEYESKHKTIISSTRIPESVSFDKTYQISRGSQTDTVQVIEELLKAVNDIKIKESFTASEVIKHVKLCNMEEANVNVPKTADRKVGISVTENCKALESTKPILHSP